MRLRDNEEIEIHNPGGGYSGMEEFMNEYNSTIEDIEKESENKLRIVLLKKDTKSKGFAYIKTKTDKGKVILDKILNRKDKMIGKTLNEFGSINSEDL